MLNFTPLIVIVTRTKNRPVFLERALNSVAKQTFKQYYHVVVNDGGNKATVESIIHKYKSENVHVIHNRYSHGMEAASNMGLNSFPAKYAAIHDDDDSWHPQFLENMVNYLETDHSIDGIVCNIKQIFERFEDDHVIHISERLFNPYVRIFNLNDFFVKNQFVPIGFVYRYDLHKTLGFYDESYSVCGDLEFNLRVLEKHKIKKISSCLANYHIRIQSNSKNALNSVLSKQTHKLQTKRLLSKYDSRDMYTKVVSYLRVQFFYRAMNILLRKIHGSGANIT